MPGPLFFFFAVILVGMSKDDTSRNAVRRRAPASFFALGYQTMPEMVQVGGLHFKFSRLYKHDFFAATALYEQVLPEATLPAYAVCPKAVLKLQRTQSLFGLPMAWLGRFIARHEIRIYQKLQGIPGIPAFLGTVEQNGFLHAFVPGEELSPAIKLGPEFFEQLRELFVNIHTHDIAYVDANKRENILVGDDGRPYLIDFQISWNTFNWARAYGWTRWLLNNFKAADWYHYYKHKTRLAPHLCTAEDFARVKQRNLFLKIHRSLAWPVIRTRRRLLARYDLDRTR
jgi:hypothetical protein